MHILYALCAISHYFIVCVYLERCIPLTPFDVCPVCGVRGSLGLVSHIGMRIFVSLKGFTNIYPRVHNENINILFCTLGICVHIYVCTFVALKSMLLGSCIISANAQYYKLST